MDKDQILTEPRVYLIGRQAVDEKVLKGFLDDEELFFETDTQIPAELIAEIAGRTCYMSFGKGRKTNAEYLERIISSHHGSVLEHAVWNFMITGVSRSLTHELIRHRAGWAYSQISQRYVDEAQARYVLPPLYRDNEELSQKWKEAIEAAHEAYVNLVKASEPFVAELHPELPPTERRKIVRQSARSVLPNACETKIFVSANARALRHFFEMRGSIHADSEIRELAVAMFRLVKEEAPNIFSDLDVILLEDTQVISVVHSKV